MKEYDLDFVKSFFNEKEIIMLIKYHANLTIAMQLIVSNFTLNNKQKLLQQKGKDFFTGKATELNYLSFLYGIKQLKDYEHKLNKKTKWTEQEMKVLERFNIEKVLAEKQKRKRAGKKEKLIKLRFKELIKKLRATGFSYRDISLYIAKNHKVKISHNYIRQIFKEIEVEK